MRWATGWASDGAMGLGPRFNDTRYNEFGYQGCIILLASRLICLIPRYNEFGYQGCIILLASRLICLISRSCESLSFPKVMYWSIFN